MKIGICGNIALDDLSLGLDQAFPGNDIIVGKPGNFLAEISGPIGDFADLDVCIMALDWRDLTPGLYRIGFGDTLDSIVAEFRRPCEEIRTMVAKFRAASTARVLIFTPLTDTSGPSGFVSRLLQPSPQAIFSECQALFDEMCRSIVDLYPIDIDDLCRRLGAEQALSASSRYHRRQPFTDDMVGRIVEHLIALFTQFKTYSIKCLALDLDNTLWGGLVGESGALGIELGNSGLGKAFRDFQAEIVRLHKQGVILAVCSKNDTCDALEAMETHPHMLIRPTMISSFRINWDDKPKSLAAIAAELKIGLDSFMFIDDNPVERALMRRALPQVEVLELPLDPAEFPETIRRCSRFWPLQITKDDAVKGGFFSAEALRKQAAEIASNVEDYLLKSGIVATIRKADAASLPRIVQLFGKTNQFNLTTIRYTQAELERLSAIEGNHLFYLSLADSFGEYGIVAAALVLDNCIDSFVLSCRAFGRQVEVAFLLAIVRYLRKRAPGCIRGRYKRSTKNTMAKQFFATAGFRAENETDDGCLWCLDDATPLPSGPPWIRQNEIA